MHLVAIAPSHIAKSSSGRKEENDYETSNQFGYFYRGVRYEIESHECVV